MKYDYLIAILLFWGCYIFSSCQKELGCEGPQCSGIYDDGKAIYSFVQNNGNCTGAVVNGAYLKATELNNANTVDIKLDVSKTGTYSISTDTINGFYFLVNKNFTSTGLQTVILNGKGKPIAAGEYTFTTSKTSGCSFTVRVDAEIVAEKYFYEFTLDGLNYKKTVEGGVRIKNYFFPGPNIALVSIITDGAIVLHQDGTSDLSGLNLSKGFIQLSSITQTGLMNYFVAGAHSFSAPLSLDGIVVTWVDEGYSAWSWSSFYLPGLQNGSNFTVTNVETYLDTQGRPIAKVKAIFNCILYNGHGDSKILTHGKFYGEFANI
jgi:hypothetical protein